MLTRKTKTIQKQEIPAPPDETPQSSAPASLAGEAGNERKQVEDELRRLKDALEAANRDLQISLAREKYLTRTDALTGINNRRYFFEFADHDFEVALRYHQPFSVILLDLDDFKQINDYFGHIAGDQMLESVTQVACAQLRSADVIGRYGGDEFVILLPVTNQKQARLVAERVRVSVAAIHLPTDQGPATITTSIGIAEIWHTPPDETVEDIIHRANKAMYAAKQAGKNRTIIFEPDKTGVSE